MRNAGNMASLVADLNNTGVAFIREGHFEEGLAFYEKTLKAIPEEQVEWRLKASYNLGLAYARQNKLDAAQAVLAACPRDDAFLVSAKIASLLARVGKALATGGTLHFASARSARPAEGEVDLTPWELPAGKAEAMANTAAEVVIPTDSLQPGDYGCYLVFRTSDAGGVDVKALLKSPPAFRPGGA
jgi:tetratricopeptide (TPR) repeat protein